MKEEILVSVALPLIEDIIKLLANAIHPNVNGGAIHGVIQNLINSRDESLKIKKDNV